MATVLCAWEMGTGLGHLGRLRVFIDMALAKGHRVVLAVRELQNVHLMCPDSPMTLFQAPRAAPPTKKIRHLSYPHLLAEHYQSGEQLALLCRAWDAIFDAVEPDLVIYDYAPAAMVAGRHRPFRKWVVGTGFVVPRLDEPLMGVFPGMATLPRDAGRLRREQDRFLAMVNECLGSRGHGGLVHLRELFLTADERLLITLPELDHFGTRPNGDYLGIQGESPDEAADWPLAGDCRVFAYLSDFPNVGDVLGALAKHGASALVYSRDITGEVKDKFPALRFVDKPVAMGMVLARADLMVTMGNHATTAQGVMAGIPQLLIPSHLEQALLATQLARQGRGLVLSRRSPDADSVVSKALDVARTGRLPYAPRRRAYYGGEQLERRLSALFTGL